MFVPHDLAVAYRQRCGSAEHPERDDAGEVIKSTLSTFNDANPSGDYSVMNLLASKPFRDTLGPDKLKAGFKEFADKHIDFTDVVNAKVVPTKTTTVNEDGVMATEGYFDTSRMRVRYMLQHLLSDGEWKVLAIDVKTDELPK